MFRPIYIFKTYIVVLFTQKLHAVEEPVFDKHMASFYVLETLDVFEFSILECLWNSLIPGIYWN